MLMEQLVVSEAIQKYIRGDTTEFDVTEIESVARREGMITTLQDGVLRVLKGETTLEEIHRVM